MWKGKERRERKKGKERRRKERKGKKGKEKKGKERGTERKGKGRSNWKLWKRKVRLETAEKEGRIIQWVKGANAPQHKIAQDGRVKLVHVFDEVLKIIANDGDEEVEDDERGDDYEAYKVGAGKRRACKNK